LTLKVGIIGVAGWFYPQTYARILKRIGEVKLVSAAHLGASDDYIRITTPGYTKDSYAEEFEVKLYKDPEEMIEKEELAAVCICGEYRLKANYIEMAAETGVDIFVAKPPATTIEEMDRILEAERKNNVKISVADPGRFSNMFSEVHSRVEDSEIGELISMRVLHQHGKLAINPDHWYLKEENGGPELSLGWYTASLLRWFINSEAIRVFAEYDNFATEGSPFMDNGKALVRFENGSVGSMDIYFSVEWPFKWMEVELMGTEGSIIATESRFERHYSIYGNEGVTSSVWDPPAPLERETNEIKDWIETCIDKTKPKFSVEEAKRVLKICLAWRESAKNNQPMLLSMG